MIRRKVDEEQVRKACAAIDDGMSVRKAAAVFGVGRTSIADRRHGKVAMNAKVGPETILSKEEEDSLEDILLFSARNYLAVDRVPLRDAVRRLCNDGRRIPWDPEKGPGKDWLAGFFRRHPRVAECSTRIYEVNRITEEEEPRMVQFYERWAALLDEVKPEANHVHETSSSGSSTTPQGTKTTKAFAESGQKVVGSMRSNSRENTTVVATISADGHTWPPTIILKGHDFRPIGL
ncbi:unnamed protein product [Pylaiella littoralis]